MQQGLLITRRREAASQASGDNLLRSHTNMLGTLTIMLRVLSNQLNNALGTHLTTSIPRRVSRTDASYRTYQGRTDLVIDIQRNYSTQPGELGIPSLFLAGDGTIVITHEKGHAPRVPYHLLDIFC